MVVYICLFFSSLCFLLMFLGKFYLYKLKYRAYFVLKIRYLNIDLTSCSLIV